MRASFKVGDVIRLPYDTQKRLYIVDRVNECSAYIVPLNGIPKNIVTSQGSVAISVRGNGLHIAPTSLVEIVESQNEAFNALKESHMSDIATETAPETTEKKKRQRITQIYVRTEKEAPEGMRGQGLTVLEALNEVKQATVAQLVTACAGKFQTKQDDARIVAFYLSKFKREGLVTTIKASEIVENVASELTN